MSGPRLVAIDLQRIFAAGPWGTPGFTDVADRVAALAARYEPVFTRFVAPERPAGSWQAYYEQWPFALQPADAPDYRLVDPFDRWDALTVDASTFGKWPALDDMLHPAPGEEFVVAGVSTDCCVISTVLAMADAGMAVRVVQDACAGVTPDTHRAAIETMRLYAPQVQIVTTADLLPERA